MKDFNAIGRYVTAIEEIDAALTARNDALADLVELCGKASRDRGDGTAIVRFNAALAQQKIDKVVAKEAKIIAAMADANAAAADAVQPVLNEVWR